MVRYQCNIQLCSGDLLKCRLQRFDILFNIVITGSVNLIFTFVGMFTVDRLGRKALMLLGAGGLAGIYAVLGSMYFFHLQGLPLLIMVVTAIACYSMTLAPVTWVVLSEIFPTGYVALQCRWLLSHYGQPVSC